MWSFPVMVSLLTLFQRSICNPVIFSFRPLQPTSITEGSFCVLSGNNVTLMLFGVNLTNNTIVAFTTDSESCSAGEVSIVRGSIIEIDSNSSSSVQTGYISVPIFVSVPKTYYFCVSQIGDPSLWHQGNSTWLSLTVKPPLLPLAIRIAFIVVLMLMSGLFSGLNLGLMALDPTTLKIIMEGGKKRQRWYAQIIFQVRKHGNYLLCTLLLGNVLMNSTLTVLLDSVLPSGLYAVVASTVIIVIIGEIVPQAICSRYGLIVGAWTIPITLLFMAITFPLSFPISLILNCILGKEIGAVYNRDQLLQLLNVTKEHHDLEKDEVDIIGGALAFKRKKARDVMTNFDDVFCLDIDSTLDFQTMKMVYESGFSRIPVFEGRKTNVVGLLYVRDLAFVDPDDSTSLASHLQFYKHDLLHFFEDTPLNDLFKGFLEGKCHLSIIQTIIEDKDKDPEYQAVGVVTLEDIVEEILQKEIVDETDRFTDNRTFKPRLTRHVDFREFMNCSISVSPQQKLAIFQFLCTEVEPFQQHRVSECQLKQLLNQPNVVQRLQDENKDSTKLYEVNNPANFFCLIIEGCMSVKVGKDDLIFESRSFSHFGAKALMNVLEDPSPEYRPDFSAWPSTDCLVLIITQQQYKSAYDASTIKGEDLNLLLSFQSNLSKDQLETVFATESANYETADLQEVSHKMGGGLASIGKYLTRKSSRKLSHNKSGWVIKDEFTAQNGFSDHRRLLSSSSEDDLSDSSTDCQDIKLDLHKCRENGSKLDRTQITNGDVQHQNLLGSSRRRTKS